MRRIAIQVGVTLGVLLIPAVYAEAQAQCPTWAWLADNHSVEGPDTVSYFTDGVHKFSTMLFGNWQWYWNDPQPGMVSLRGTSGRGFMFSMTPGFGEELNVDTGITVAARVKPVVLSGEGSLVISVNNSSTADVDADNDGSPDGSTHLWVGWDSIGSANGDITFNSRSGVPVRAFEASVNIRDQWTVWTYTAKQIQYTMAWDLWINGVPQAQDQPAPDSSLHTVVWSDSTDMGTSVNIGQRRSQSSAHDTVWDWVCITNAGVIPAWDPSPCLAKECDSMVVPSSPQSATALRGQPAVPPSIVYTISNLGAQDGMTYTVAESDAAGNPLPAPGYAWLALDKADGGPLDSLASDTVTAGVTDTAGTPGDYTGYVTFTDSCTPATKHVRQINLRIIGCRMEISPQSGVYRTVASPTAPVDSVIYTFTNTGAGTISYTVEKMADCPWLSLDKTAGGPVTTFGTDKVTASINLAGLAEGTYSCQLKFTPDCTEPPMLQPVYRTVHLSIRGSSSTAKWLNAEFNEFDFQGRNEETTSPLVYCPSAETASLLMVSPDWSPTPMERGYPDDWIFLGLIDGILTTARFSYDGNDWARAALSASIPLGAGYDPAKGMAVAYRMRTGSYDGPVRGPIKIWTDARPAMEGAFEAFIGIYQGTRVRPMMECCGVPSTLLPNVEELVLPEDISSIPEAPVYHTWSVSSCYDAAFDPWSAYYNVWLDGKQLFFGGSNGTVTGPAGATYSFRNQLDPNDISDRQFQAAQTAAIELGEEANEGSERWDFEFDWVRVLTLDVAAAPYWDGQGGCEPSHAPWPDVDEDGDADQVDFATLQICYTGSGDPNGAFDRLNCGRFDRDRDKDVDRWDVEEFVYCATGPGVPLDPSSLPAGCDL